MANKRLTSEEITGLLKQTLDRRSPDWDKEINVEPSDGYFPGVTITPKGDDTYIRNSTYLAQFAIGNGFHISVGSYSGGPLKGKPYFDIFD